MKPFETSTPDDVPLSKLESHIQHLPRTPAPATWKTDILAAAKHAQSERMEASKSIDVQTDQAYRSWLHALISWCKLGFQLITPVRATVAVIWILALCGVPFDAWLNGNPTSGLASISSPAIYLSISEQLNPWEIAGLEYDDVHEEPSNAPQTENENPSEYVPGPKSQRNGKRGANHHHVSKHHNGADRDDPIYRPLFSII